MPRHHLIISGTGRAGTTFLVQLLTELKMDTGFSNSATEILEECNAGMEKDIRKHRSPYVIKNPALCEHLDQTLKRGDIVVDHAIVPVRDLYSAAESRRQVTRRNAPEFAGHGGLWHTQNPDEQEAILAFQLYNLIYVLAKHDIPMTLLQFPRCVNDADYLYEKIKGLLPKPDRDLFLSAFHKVSRPELVHDFQPPAKNEAPANSFVWGQFFSALKARCLG